MKGAAKRGFTLVETVISVALIGVGVVAAFSALAAIENAFHRARESEVIQRLAVEKYDEIVATGSWSQAPLSGNFGDQNYTFNAEVSPSGYEHLMTLTLTVRSQSFDAREVVIAGVVYSLPLNGGSTP